MPDNARAVGRAFWPGGERHSLACGFGPSSTITRLLGLRRLARPESSSPYVTGMSQQALQTCTTFDIYAWTFAQPLSTQTFGKVSVTTISQISCEQLYAYHSEGHGCSHLRDARLPRASRGLRPERPRFE